MARKRDIKTVEAVGSKSLGRKRAVDDAEVKAPRKRQKTKGESKIASKSQHVQDQLHVPDSRQDQVFRFLDLPGELRNRIYEIIAARSYKLFPHTHVKPKSSKSGPYYTPAKPLPYMGLTQTCTLIRSEFRSMWLSTHRFPLFALPGYFKSFFPLRRITTTKAARDPDTEDNAQQQRIVTTTTTTTAHDPQGTLRLWFRRDDLFSTLDIIRLLKHRARFPQSTITLDATEFSQAVDADVLLSLSAIINNDNPKWIKWIKASVITQVRLGLYTHISPTGGLLRIIIKERYAVDWMRWNLKIHADKQIPKGFVEGLGLGGVTPWEIEFGIDYS